MDTIVIVPVKRTALENSMKMIDLLGRVPRVSVETQAIVEAMRKTSR